MKIYGEAEVTVSDCNDIVDPVTVGNGFAGVFCTWYLIWVAFTLSETTNCPLYPVALNPSIRKGVSTSSPAIADAVVTVMEIVDTVPSPALILVIPTVSPVDPTIRCSSIFAWISISVLG